jgi:hypothetical protein
MRYIAFYGAIASIVLIVIATISVKHYKSTVEDYNADPDKINEK